MAGAQPRLYAWGLRPGVADFAERHPSHQCGMKPTHGWPWSSMTGDLHCVMSPAFWFFIQGQRGCRPSLGKSGESQAAWGSSGSLEPVSNPTYQCPKGLRDSSLSTRVRIWRSRRAPRELHCICEGQIGSKRCFPVASHPSTNIACSSPSSSSHRWTTACRWFRMVVVLRVPSRRQDLLQRLHR
jgi:hypothetical protein